MTPKVHKVGAVPAVQLSSLDVAFIMLRSTHFLFLFYCFLTNNNKLTNYGVALLHLLQVTSLLYNYDIFIIKINVKI